MTKGYIIRHLQAGDERVFAELVSVFHEVFNMQERSMPGPVYLSSLLLRPGFIVLVACDGDEVVGGLTGYMMPGYYSETAELYIYDIAVTSRQQGHGVGRLLLAALKEYCLRNNIVNIMVEAHVEDTAAIEFYRASGGRAENVIHFNYGV